MEGNRTIGEGSFNFEAGKYKPDPEFDDCLNIWMPKHEAWSVVQSLLHQLKEDDGKRDIMINFCGELKFEKEEQGQ